MKALWVVFWVPVLLFIVRPMVGALIFYFFQWRNNVYHDNRSRVELKLYHETALDLYCWYFDNRKYLTRSQHKEVCIFAKRRMKETDPSDKMTKDHYWKLLQDARPKAYKRWQLWEWMEEELAFDTLIWRIRRLIVPRKRK